MGRSVGRSVGRFGSCNIYKGGIRLVTGLTPQTLIRPKCAVGARPFERCLVKTLGHLGVWQKTDKRGLPLGKEAVGERSGASPIACFPFCHWGFKNCGFKDRRQWASFDSVQSFLRHHHSCLLFLHKFYKFHRQFKTLGCPFICDTSIFYRCLVPEARLVTHPKACPGQTK